MAIEGRYVFHEDFMDRCLNSTQLINDIQKVILTKEFEGLSDDEKLSIINKKINVWRFPKIRS